MSNQRVTLALLLGVSMVLSTSAVSAQEETATKQPSLETRLLGTWLFAGKPGSNESPKPNATMRFWGAKKFVILRVDPETGAVVNCHGGTYHIDGDTYEEKIEFANEKRRLLIGGQFKYRIKVEGDVYTQEGIGNDFNERWVRQTTVGEKEDEEHSTGKFFDSNGVKLHYVEMGRGETVISVHGAGGDPDPLNKPLLKTLAQRFRVIAIDQRGFGKSDKPENDEAYGLEMVNDLVRLLDHLEVDQAHFVGISMGGAVVAKLSMTNPDRVKSAVVVAPPATESRAEFAKGAEVIAAGFAKRDIEPLFRAMTPKGRPLPPPAMMKVLNEQFWKDKDPKALAACGRALHELCSDLSERQACPVRMLAIVGSEDTARPGLKEMAEVIPNAKFVEVRGKNHMDLPLSQEFVEAVVTFVSHPESRESEYQ